MAEPQHAATPAERLAPGWLLVAAMAGFGILVVLAAAAPVHWTVTSRYFPLDGARTYTPTPIPRSSTNDLELPPTTPLGWTAPLFWTLLAVAGLVLAGWLLRRLWDARPRRRVELATRPTALPTGSVSAAAQAQALRRGARSALELLDEVPDPQDAVIRCWLALEQAAMSSGAPRRPSDSPTEFARTVLSGTGADRDSIKRLLHLYQRARFSGHPVGLDEVRQARTCVAGLSRSLEGYEAALRRSAATSTSPSTS